MGPTKHVRSGTTPPSVLSDGAGPAESSQATVLLADDDDHFRESLSIWLRNDRRWDVREAANGREALDKIDDAVDILVLDRQMPVLSGPAVFERLDETPFDGRVLVLSAYEPDTHLDENEVADYVTKPIDQEEFLDRLERNLP